MANESNLGNAIKNMDTTATGNETVSGASLEILLLNLKKAENAQLASIKVISEAEKLYDEQIYKQKVEHIKATAADEKEAASKIKKLQENRINDITELAILLLNI